MTKFIDPLEAGFGRLNSFLIALVASSIGLFALSIPINIAMVKFGAGAIWWLNEAIEYALYAGVFLGAPYVLSKGGHVRIDIFAASLPRHFAVKLEKFVDALGFVLCIVLCVYGLRAAAWEFANGTLPDKNLRIANWYILAVFSFSLFLLAVEFLFRFRRAESIVAGEAARPTQASL